MSPTVSATDAPKVDAEHRLDVIDVHRSFGDVTAVDGISFSVAPGETYGLLGPNGAGKTTTIAMIVGLLTPENGRVLVCGHSAVPTSPEVRAHIGYVPQGLAVYPDLTGRENLSLFGRLCGLRGGDLDRRVDEVLEVTGLSDRAGSLSREYSGGMERRLNIGVGLLHRPDVLILDEPTVGVDPQSRNAILDAVEVLSAEGVAVLYTTHYMEEAERLCDRIGIVDSGRLIAEGTVDELLHLNGTADTVSIGCTGPMDLACRRLASLDGVVSAVVDRHSIVVTLPDAPTHVASLLGAASESGVAITEVLVSRPDLESVFLRLTGRRLRD